ncbi:Na(+)/H(+) antiporter subunit C [Paeniglutamicibacter psychrophenolicus]|uniref:Multicomponent Na+:H+ antiporter subunit C n=1 Tax=Paeniglutamicibacter psychrophenolicus TaxID=257454 RepID=A0ABS4WBX5_9MICC|nr:Na(+)/H(+) antiporter subunit C [Paeniglutamicibacter psychrophenolicus]MBP2373694.1 multicomponent Na+:H+ antiporter subunit C [Paeniglutamicibacter psychrophenolicus]
MSTNITLLIVMGVLFAVGIYLLLERSLTRVLLGIVLLGNGVNLLILTAGGRRGQAPLYQDGLAAAAYTDPLPQALILTAIVITFAVTAFMLGIIYRSWVISRADVVADDDEDLRVSQQSTFDFEEDSPVPEDTTEFEGEDSEPAGNHPEKGPRA